MPRKKKGGASRAGRKAAKKADKHGHGKSVQRMRGGHARHRHNRKSRSIDRKKRRSRMRQRRIHATMRHLRGVRLTVGTRVTEPTMFTNEVSYTVRVVCGEVIELLDTVGDSAADSASVRVGDGS